MNASAKNLVDLTEDINYAERRLKVQTVSHSVCITSLQTEISILKANEAFMDESEYKFEMQELYAKIKKANSEYQAAQIEISAKRPVVEVSPATLSISESQNKKQKKDLTPSKLFTNSSSFNYNNV